MSGSIVIDDNDGLEPLAGITTGDENGNESSTIRINDNASLQSILELQGSNAWVCPSRSRTMVH